MKKRESSPHQACRSLLQKAVRRGDAALVRRVVDHLLDAGEGRWLRGRAHVISFEECWPIFGGTEGNLPDPVSLLLQLTRSVKMKDAAGLGFLAYAIHKGEKIPGLSGEEEKACRIVGSAPLRPGDFWTWARKTAGAGRALEVVDAARDSYRHAGWAWDKMTVLAAAWLAATGEVPEVKAASLSLPCPLWAGVDRHTEEGKAVLARVAKRLRLSAKDLGVLSFCLEGALCNEAIPSAWWEREVNRQLESVGMTRGEAEKTWRMALPLVRRELENASISLERHLLGG